MNKTIKLMAVALFSLILAGLLAACGDATSTPGTAATSGSATTAAGATTAAMTSAAATTAAMTSAAATTAAMTSAAATTASATTAATATTAAAASGGAGGTIVIYSSLPLTGSSQKQTSTIVNAMQLALDDATGGTGKLGNFTIKFTSLDDATAAKGQWDAAQEATNANKAVADPDAMIYLGTFNSGAAKISIPILNQASMAMISPGNTLACLTRYDAPSGCSTSEPADYYKANPSLRNYFRVVTADDIQGPADVAFIQTQGAKKVFVIDDSQAYGKGVADAFAGACKDAGIDCSQRSSINGKESDYKSLTSTIKNAAPDFIFFGGITQQQAPKLLSDIRGANIKNSKGEPIPFMGSDGIQEQAFIDGAGAAAEGAYSSVEGVDESKLPAKGQDFLKRYRAKFGEPEAYTIYGYSAMNVALDAIKRAGVKDRKAIVQALSATKDFQDVSGTWSFDKNGDTTLTDYVVAQVKNGKWVFVTQTKAKPKTT